MVGFPHFLWLNNIPVCMYTPIHDFFTHSSTDTLPVLPLVNNVVMIVGVRRSFSLVVLFLWIYSQKWNCWILGCMKRHSVTLLIREVPIKTTVSDHLTPVRMATIKKIRENTCLEKREPLCPVGGVRNGYSCNGRSSENRTTHLIHKMF